MLPGVRNSGENGLNMYIMFSADKVEKNTESGLKLAGTRETSDGDAKDSV